MKNLEIIGISRGIETYSFIGQDREGKEEKMERTEKNNGLLLTVLKILLFMYIVTGVMLDIDSDAVQDAVV